MEEPTGAGRGGLPGLPGPGHLPPGIRSGRRPPEGGTREEALATAEISAIGERLYQAVCAKPGAPMTVLAVDVGATPRALNRPMMHLKRAGKIRSVGQRHLTRYFPLVGETAGQA